MLDVLAIGAHPDDVEIGMGGAVASFVASGLQVGILDLTDGEPTPFGSVEQRAAEAEAAAATLQVAVRRTLDLPNRELMDTIEARRKVAEVFRELRPRTLFMHYWDDAHPDHVQACRLCEAARFYAKLTKTDMAGEPFYPGQVFYHFSNHLKIHPQPSFILDTSQQMERKMASIRCYHSQFIKERQDPDAFFNLVHRIGGYWGWLIGTEFGEPFVSREPLGLRGIGELIR